MRKLLFRAIIAATLGVYLAMVLWSLPKLSAMAGGGLPFDLRPFGYAPDEARGLLAALGEEGRGFYRDTQHRLDLFFPGLLALSLVLLFRRLLAGVPGLILSALALLAAAFDWAENAAVAGLLAAPEATDAMIEQASRLTVIKSGLGTAVLVALLVLLIRAGWRRWQGIG